MYSGVFDLTKTYFLIAGIAGVNPARATTGSVTFARFEVQVALQYEFDIRDIGSNFSTGYIPYGTHEPNAYPTLIYGTEVFEVNDALRKKVSGLNCWQSSDRPLSYFQSSTPLFFLFPLLSLSLSLPISLRLSNLSIPTRQSPSPAPPN